jgi:hypothetical protein
VPLCFLPQPKRFRRHAGRFRIPRAGTIGIGSRGLAPAGELAKDVLPRHRLAIAAAGTSESMRVHLRAGLRPGEYRLRVGPRGVGLEAASVAAAFWGIQTLRQAARQSPPGTLPALAIDDWPDLADRGVYYDVARGRVPKPERLAHLAETLAAYKVNQLQLYVEHTFRFRRHADIGRRASPLTAQDVLDLDAVCGGRRVELVPSLASFGHMASVLRHKRYRHLAEDWGVGRYVSGEAQPNPALRGWTLSPANPQAYAFLRSLWEEFLPLFASGRFNVCCDETWDLGWGQSHALCRRRGRGRVYLDHVRRLRDLAGEFGKRIMFWGDVIRRYPELIGEIPGDVTVLDWGYGADHDFAAIRDFGRVRGGVYACPGTSSWRTLFPRLHEAAANIAGFAAAAKAHGAAGLLNTDWGDGGHANFMEWSWHGYLFGAEQAWNARADRRSFTRRFCRLFLHVDDAAFARAVDALGDVTHLRFGTFYQSIWHHVFFAVPGEPALRGGCDAAELCRGGRLSRRRIVLDARVGRQALRRLEAIRGALAAGAARAGADPHGVLPYWRFAVDTLRHAARKLAALAPGGRATPARRRALRGEMAALRDRFEALWMRSNRRSEIRRTLRRYDRVLRAMT